MQVSQPPLNEKERLEALYSYSILDTLSERDYDNLTVIASEICEAKIALVSLVDSDRQWFKSAHGTHLTETKREHAFCAHATNTPNEMFIVADARIDSRFADNPLVTQDPQILFYAGAPLVTEKGLPLGTLCAINDSTKTPSEHQIRPLKALSQQVMNLLELRKQKQQLEITSNKLTKKTSLWKSLYRW